jgi:hypothetical protein
MNKKLKKNLKITMNEFFSQQPKQGTWKKRGNPWKNYQQQFYLFIIHVTIKVIW